MSKSINSQAGASLPASRGYTSPSRDESKLSQDLLRHLKGKMSFWQVESMREGLACLRRGLTDAEFHELCDDLARDTVLYGDI